MANNWVVNMAYEYSMVHRTSCSFASRESRGLFEGMSGWFGPYASRGAAIDVAVARGVLVRECEHCITTLRINAGWQHKVQ